MGNKIKITTNDNINYEMNFDANLEEGGSFKVDENHLIDLEIESNNNLINNKKIKVYILENIEPELVDNFDNKIEFLTSNNNIYKINILKGSVISGIRGKYKTVPVPGSEATLNQADLLTDARSEKEALITNLREMLDQTSRQSKLERRASETDNLNKVLSGVPYTIYVG